MPFRSSSSSFTTGRTPRALGLLVADWNAYQATVPADEAAARERLHEVLIGVLVGLWSDLPPRLLHPPADGG